jgi:hypothetical protein
MQPYSMHPAKFFYWQCRVACWTALLWPAGRLRDIRAHQAAIVEMAIYRVENWRPVVLLLAAYCNERIGELDARLDALETKFGERQ